MARARRRPHLIRSLARDGRVFAGRYTQGFYRGRAVHKGRRCQSKQFSTVIVGAAIADHAKTRPDRTALVFDGQKISWQGLETLCRRAASWIQAKDPDGLSVALHLPNCPALVVLFSRKHPPRTRSSNTRCTVGSCTDPDLVGRLNASLVISEAMIGAEGVYTFQVCPRLRGPVRLAEEN